VHLVGVAGTGMGSFAGMLKSAGHAVSGSDENVYPPMSDKLREWGIEVMKGYRAENLDTARPDLVVIGNVIRRDNPEAAAVRERALPQMSFPQALGELFLKDRHSVVVAGTHGKTTATALVAHLLADADRDPSLLVGGVPLNFGDGYRIGRGAHFVIEGDEYDTAYFDKGPKFLHYRPRTVLFTGAELDHIDIYRDEAHYESAFERLFPLIPADGFLAACATFASTGRLLGFANCRVETYSASAEADWRAADVSFGPEGARFAARYRGERWLDARLPLGGRHNVENALGAIAVARALGLSPGETADALAAFRGVKRRQEVRGVAAGVTVIDDFAHHPTAVRETVAAVRALFPRGRLIAVYEPRSNTAMRKVHAADYPRAFAGADLAVIAPPGAIHKVPENERMDPAALAAEVTRNGVPARTYPSVDAIVEALAAEARPGDVILAMSNGAFGGIHGKLLEALGRRDGNTR
jgi:UDP-N-acetylmuramate: L-alanyl-gamma-D-glutamyl-meso-diaminopimelate ligase